jgi:hypothetical protein
MDSELKRGLIWLGCGLLSIVILYVKQGRCLTEHQPVACLLYGPLSLCLAVFLPPSMLTSREKAHPAERNSHDRI